MPEPIDIHKTFASYFTGIEPWAYAVSEVLEQGSICLDVNRYLELLDQGLAENPLANSSVKLISKSLEKSEHVSMDPGKIHRPFIFENGRLYMQRYFVYQTRIVEKIKSLIEEEGKYIESRKNCLLQCKDLIKRIFPDQEDDSGTTIERINWQKVAALNTCLNNFSIITGGPGTGKTTTVAKILTVLYHQNPELKVALAAPTGKAAARMAESLHLAKESIAGITDEIRKLFDTMVPKTIHRLLETQPQSTLFRHNSENPLEYDMIIIDEASMVDSALMYKLIEAVRPENRIILLGDKNQLASVEAGSIFGDLCRTQSELMNQINEDRFNFCNDNFGIQIPEDYKLKDSGGNQLFDHIIQLKRNYRTESQEINTMCSLIIDNAPGKIAEFISLDYENKPVIFDNSYDANILDQWALAYMEYIVEENIVEALKKLNRIRVLCAVREGRRGIYMINKHIEQFLKSRVNNPNLFMPSSGFYHNQIIIVTSNNYELGVFNGDTGLIRRRSESDPVLTAYFESNDPEKPKEIPPGYLNDYETVYAMTIHKSQGSEYDSVAVILPENENSLLLTRELLYTGISRARKKALIQAPVNVLYKTISREVSRASGICDQF